MTPLARLSSFTIFSEPLPDGGRVLMNGCSGAVDLLPRPLAHYLHEVHRSSPKGQAFVDAGLLHPDTFASLTERGHLTRQSVEQERAALTEIALGLHDQEKRRPYLMIAPSMDCNYRCVYCFERPLQHGIMAAKRSGLAAAAPSVLRLDDVPLVFDAIAHIQGRSGADPGGMVILYGGEPLDAANRDVVFEIVRTGRSRGFWFAAVTNGHDLSEFLPLLGPGGIRQVQVSFDGPKPIHDRRRISLDGASSFERIASNLRDATRIEGLELHLRVHVEPTSLEHFAELMRFFEQQRWTDNPKVVIYASTVYQKDSAGRVCAGIGVAELAERLEAVASRFRNVWTSAPAVHVARSLLSVLDSGRRYPLRGDYCSANFGNYIFLPDGHIYACWESIGKAPSRIGTYRRAGGPELDRGAVDRWFGRSVAVVSGCLDCEYALVCGGGCAQYAEYNTGQAGGAFCDSFQQMFQRALADEVTRHFNTGSAEGNVQLRGLV